MFDKPTDSELILWTMIVSATVFKLAVSIGQQWATLPMYIHFRDHNVE